MPAQEFPQMQRQANGKPRQRARRAPLPTLRRLLSSPPPFLPEGLGLLGHSLPTRHLLPHGLACSFRAWISAVRTEGINSLGSGTCTGDVQGRMRMEIPEFQNKTSTHPDHKLSAALYKQGVIRGSPSSRATLQGSSELF